MHIPTDRAERRYAACVLCGDERICVKLVDIRHPNDVAYVLLNNRQPINVGELRGRERIVGNRLGTTRFGQRQNSGTSRVVAIPQHPPDACGEGLDRLPNGYDVGRVVHRKSGPSSAARRHIVNRERVDASAHRVI